MFVFFLLSLLFTLPPSSHAYAIPSKLFISDLLAAHNNVRAAHNAPLLTWSYDFAEKASSWADQCLLQLTGGTLSDIPYGELQVAGSGSFTVQDALNMFIQDESKYIHLEKYYSLIDYSSHSKLRSARSRTQPFHPGCVEGNYSSRMWH
jgi:Cysteine-rich secretory protein family